VREGVILARKKFRIITCGLFILINIFCLNIVSANSTYSISGKITDSDFKPIKDAKIVFEMDGGTNGIQIASTDERGNYTVKVPIKGKAYWVTIGKEGYKTHRSKVQLVDKNDDFVFDFVLNK